MTKQTFNECYDTIVATFERNNYIVPHHLIYGDGSRWDNDPKAFYQLYLKIVEMMLQNDLIEPITLKIK